MNERINMKQKYLKEMLEKMTNKKIIPFVLKMVMNKEEQMIQFLMNNKNLTLTDIVMKANQLKHED